MMTKNKCQRWLVIGQMRELSLFAIAKSRITLNSASSYICMCYLSTAAPLLMKYFFDLREQS